MPTLLLIVFGIIIVLLLLLWIVWYVAKSTIGEEEKVKEMINNRYEDDL